ncbi:MAG: type III pantothenate kinase [Limnobacter sp.]|nr:type III pantothenate kinase [Limnobacter sp.]
MGNSALLQTRYQADQLGTDRWLACLAVAAQTQVPINCVASFGTATTIDAVVESPCNTTATPCTKRWEHLGGVILPGVDLMFGSLARHASQLPQAALQDLTDFETRAVNGKNLESVWGRLARKGRFHGALPKRSCTL